MKTIQMSPFLTLAGQLWPSASQSALTTLSEICTEYGFSIARGDVILIERGWYVTHTGLLSLARRHRCAGIVVEALEPFCSLKEGVWAFQAKVFTSKSCRGFSGIGDATPATVPQHLCGCEMRIAETRAVNRALRKAYGIGLCSVEELGSSPTPPSNGSAKRAGARLGANLEVITPTPLRDQLRQLIRQHRLDPVLTKSYVLEHLGVKVLRDASREQVAELVEHLQKRLFEDRDGFLEELAKLSAPAEQKEVA
jgi:hypothetical protein